MSLDRHVQMIQVMPRLKNISNRIVVQGVKGRLVVPIAVDMFLVVVMLLIFGLLLPLSCFIMESFTVACCI